MAQLADRHVQCGRERAAQRLVRPRLELAGPQSARTAAERGAFSSTVLPTPRSPVSDRPFRAAVGHPLQGHVEGRELLVAADSSGRRWPAPGAYGFRTGSMDRTVCACLVPTRD